MRNGRKYGEEPTLLVYSILLLLNSLMMLGSYCIGFKPQKKCHGLAHIFRCLMIMRLLKRH